MRTFIADRGDARLRLDQAIVRRLSDVPRISRTRVQRWIEEQLVLVNEHPARRASAIVASGDRVSVLAPEALEIRRRPQAEQAPLDILFEDECVLVVNKPPGVVAHPAYKNPSGTLLNAILGYAESTVRLPSTSFGPGKPDTTYSLVHRLDKDTSGVLLVAKSPAIHARLQRAMTDGRTRKEYLAVVQGRPRPPRGVIALPLGRDDADRRTVVVRPDGQSSETRYAVSQRSADMSLVRCELVTGRTHQIRVHLAASGWPIVGDVVYGKPSGLIGRQALHAWRLTFPHPVSGAATEVTAPPPPDFARLLEALSAGARSAKADQNFTL